MIRKILEFAAQITAAAVALIVLWLWFILLSALDLGVAG